MKFFSDFAQCFTNEKYLSAFLEGLKLTFFISVGAAIVGLFLGTVVALVKLSKGKSIWMKVPRALCDIYITVIRGTPMAVQLFTMAFVIFAIRGFPQVVTAILAFGINSGAYVAENIRAGILSVDIGQTEAARSLGLNQRQNMRFIVLPQAIKNTLPAIANEFVTIIKESSITYTVGVKDIMSAVNATKGSLYIVMEPLIVATVMYFCLTFPTSKIIAYFERRMSRGDKR